MVGRPSTTPSGSTIRTADVPRDTLLVVMTACSGALDAAAYLRLHAFTANMTGNTVLFGLALGGRHLGDATHNIIAVGTFVAGAFAATLLGRKSEEGDRWPAVLARAFGLEVLLLLAAGWLWHANAAKAGILAAAAAAMGVQSAITRDIHGGGASTTYMGGTTARIGEFVADALRMGFRGGAVLNAAAWLVYLAAAVGVGSLDVHGRDVGALFWIVAAVIVVVAVAGRSISVRCNSLRR